MGHAESFHVWCRHEPRLHLNKTESNKVPAIVHENVFKHKSCMDCTRISLEQDQFFHAWCAWGKTWKSKLSSFSSSPNSVSVQCMYDPCILHMKSLLPFLIWLCMFQDVRDPPEWSVRGSPSVWNRRKVRGLRGWKESWWHLIFGTHDSASLFSWLHMLRVMVIFMCMIQPRAYIERVKASLQPRFSKKNCIACHKSHHVDFATSIQARLELHMHRNLGLNYISVWHGNIWSSANQLMSLHMCGSLLSTKFPDDERFRIYKVYRKVQHSSAMASVNFRFQHIVAHL